MTDLIETNFSFPEYVRDLLRLAVPTLPTISVAVPNYNYAHCLPERLYTIFDQNHPVEEIIVLDDCSSDDSIPVIMKLADERQRDLSLVINEQNSGSVFAQWAKAAEMATGEFLWIAEADDLSEPTFLSSLLALMKSDPDIALGFTDFEVDRCRRRTSLCELQAVFRDHRARSAVAYRRIRRARFRHALSRRQEHHSQRQLGALAPRRAAACAGSLPRRPEALAHGRRLANLPGVRSPRRAPGLPMSPIP